MHPGNKTGNRNPLGKDFLASYLLSMTVFRVLKKILVQVSGQKMVTAIFVRGACLTR
jgi:hypothetical protein